jgi:multicomponent K+:H+ antiporter subunit F
MTSLTATVLPVVGAAFALALVLAFYRLLRGPALVDRVLALDTLYVNALALLIVLGIGLGDPVYFEAALLIAVFGFVGTVAAARYLQRGSVVE